MDTDSRWQSHICPKRLKRTFENLLFWIRIILWIMMKYVGNYFGGLRPRWG